MVRTQHTPVSPIELAPLEIHRYDDAVPQSSHEEVPSEVSSNPSHAANCNNREPRWLPFTLHWYYLVATNAISLCFGSALVFLAWYSKRNHGLGADNGSSAILFGWRFTPTLFAVLYTQMTVILFEDVKRTEPFARLAKATPEGTGAYGTVLQTPRAWWSILADVCFRRKQTGKTSWSLLCTALINIVALLAISPLSSALLSSEEILISKPMGFTRLTSRSDTQIPIITTRETYFRTMSALMRNVSTSAWIQDTSLIFPFWPSSEAAQLGPTLASSFNAWKTESTTLRSEYQCQEMTLESANMTDKRYSGVYSVQQYGPYNGTQPMVTFVLKSGDGCRYELSMHPLVDLAYNGGVTWSNASTFYPTEESVLNLGNRIIHPNVTSTHVFARLNTSGVCNGRDIIIMSTPWTAPVNLTAMRGVVPVNMTYEHSPAFHMRGLLCDSEYFVSKKEVATCFFNGSQPSINTDVERGNASQKVQDNLIDISKYQAMSLQNDWKAYFDHASMQTDAKRAATTILGPLDAGKFPGFSGMGPLLAALSDFNLTAILEDRNISQNAARIKGRFFMETIREAFNSPQFVQEEIADGHATMVEERVVVLTEIGFTLAALFFTSSLLLTIVFWTSRLPRRPLNLRSDPASTIGMSLLLNPQLARASTFRNLHNASKSNLYAALQKERYLTSNQSLIKGNTKLALVSPSMKAKNDWRPRVIFVRTLLALCLLLTLILVAVLILNAFSVRAQLFQTAFIYQADISKFGLSFSTFAPVSIAPTLISIIVGLWWDQLDTTFRILQPYISMSHGPTAIAAGAGLTYRSKSWVGAAFKAARNKHWVLFMVTVGSIFVQVLTVSMSALFEQQTTTVTHRIALQQDLEVRQIPIISEVTVRQGDRPNVAPMNVIKEVYLNSSKNWLFGAGLQDSFNGSRLPWTSDSWSFVPIDISVALDYQNTKPSSHSDTDNLVSASMNISIAVTAIRARLECNPMAEILNVSSWLDLVNVTDTENLIPEDAALVNRTKNLQLYTLPPNMFANTRSHTTTLATPVYVTCCTNGTNNNPQTAAIGYWSAVVPPAKEANGETFPYNDIAWPLSIVSKWIVGNPISLRQPNGDIKFYFKEVPRIQATQCRPIIESAAASVLVDARTQEVHSYQIDRPATPVDLAWGEVFTRHELSSGSPINDLYAGPLNVTTSFGILFLDSLLGAADRRDTIIYSPENLDDNAFVFRDQERGINLDLMTNSMYTLANKDTEALLDYATLVDLANRTLGTFFQHFVNSGLSNKDGGYAYQSISDHSMEGLGHSIDTNGTLKAEAQVPDLTSTRTVTGTVSNRIRVLHTNTVATYLSTAILIWLIGTTFIIVGLQRRYTSAIYRDVQLIADMLILVAGSDNLLELVEKRGVALKKDKDVKTMLGWFKGRDGEIRWGVEVVGGRDAVEWVGTPKQGWHVRDKTFLSEWSLPWRRK